MILQLPATGRGLEHPAPQNRTRGENMPWDSVDRRRDEDEYPVAVQRLSVEERVRIARRIREEKGR